MTTELAKLAKELTVAIFDEDIVKPELEFDVPSLKLVMGIITTGLEAALAQMTAQCNQLELEAHHERYAHLAAEAEVVALRTACEQALLGVREITNCRKWKERGCDCRVGGETAIKILAAALSRP